MTDLEQKIIPVPSGGSRLRRINRMVAGVVKERRNQTWALQCHDIFAAIVGIIFWKGRVIYDSHEIYESFVNNTVLRRIVRQLERFSIRRADIIVFPSRERADYYNADTKKTRFVENLFFPYETNKSWDEPICSTSRFREMSGSFVYTGLFTPARSIAEIVEAFGDPKLSHCRLVLAGKRTDFLGKVLDGAADNISYIGELAHPEVCELLEHARAGFALYMPVNENNKRCAPTKIFELLHYGVHVIANESEYVKKVRAEIGEDRISVVDAASASAIVSAVLRVPETRSAPTANLQYQVNWMSQIDVLKSLYM